jgi:hypothetical protein
MSDCEDSTAPMIVMVAYGEKMVTDSLCTKLQFEIQGHEFEGELRLLNITGYDMILGLDWLGCGLTFHPTLFFLT